MGFGLFSSGTFSNIAKGVIGDQFVYISVTNHNIDSSSVSFFTLVENSDFALQSNMEMPTKDKYFL